MEEEEEEEEGCVTAQMLLHRDLRRRCALLARLGHAAMSLCLCLYDKVPMSMSL